MFIRFGIINIHKVFRVEVDTNLGILQLVNYSGIDERIRAMGSYNIPLITSVVDIFPNRINFRTVRDIVNESIDIVQDFLKVTSLSELAWHDWAFVEVYERIENTEKAKLIFRKLGSPKIKSPKSYSLTPIVYSNDFIKTAWSGYCKELDDIYGFNVALEWLIESAIPDISETKYLAATTCFEMLTDKFNSQNETEFILNRGTFKEFFSIMKKHASDELKFRGIDRIYRCDIYNSLRGINRRSYVDKAKTLVDYWGILYDDTGITLDEIKDVRNDITHRGKYSKEGEEGLLHVIKAYHGLMTILTRIFLAMLGYDKYYQDPFMEGKWIEFSSVCNKN